MHKYFLILLMFITSFLSPQHHTIHAETHKQHFNKLTDYLERNANLQGSISAVSIRSALSGELLYSHNGDTSLTPASNMKLFTAASALEILGSKYTFDTEIWTDGHIKWNGLIGNVYLKGKGDPTLLPKDFDQFAKKLRSKGIRYISGDLIGDDSWYDDVRYSIDLPWSDETANYGAQISALTASPDKDYDAGTMRIEIAPALKEEEAPIINFTPKLDYLKIYNRAKTVAATNKNTLTIKRKHGKNELIIEGEIPINQAPVREWVSVWDTTNYALSLFKYSLKENGIKLVGDITKGNVPKHSDLLLKHSSLELEKLLVPFMKLSNNTIAEGLIKEMGKVKEDKGSWKSGIKVENDVLTKLGVPIEQIVIRDGSGVSHMNLVQANVITQLLYEIKQATWFQVYYRSLPVSGENNKLTGGTLSNRMTNNHLKEKVIAKTGTLTNVSTLSGYTTMNNGDEIIFSILLNHLKEDQNGKAIEEDILKIITNP
ncbi:D-alanyl-D-alanine carboxypeptidase/D-alanyl-D-alanine-endopeptidase [Metabacillus litoralis]|uniref:D-alanyl-D-alanine carboxypeptidase/D-alanyl-D-alanine endopeptidase n=1 Tax=Metabacillus litoralis TaxID=152268 RepID=UPI001CFF036C|nr:D-alanyl-D-alanine carboxypeptidase/D-alanyl-D-alanine-endopeptidase [Metabacillus litoralis]